MKLKVMIDNRSFDVEVGDLSRQPVLVRVDGLAVEVWTSAGEEIAAVRPAPAPPAPLPPAAAPRFEPLPLPARPVALAALPSPAVPPPGPGAAKILAPIPGVVNNLFVTAGDVVKVGQELCVIEAMKMKNVIRANRPGRILRVHASLGQHIRHHEPLFDLELIV